MSPTFTALLQALIAFYALQSFPLAASYSIDNRSCKQYYTDGKDKTSMIQEGMTGAQKMIRNAVGSILRAEYGNTARQMFKDSSLPELTSIQGRYQNIGQSGAWNFIDTPSSLVEAQVYILCGDATFFPNPSSGDYAWFETTSGVTYITDVNHRTNPNDRICGPKSAGITFDALLKDDITSPGPHDYKILVLCDAALYRGGATDTKGSVSSIDSLAALPSNVQGSAGLYHGKTLDNVYFATILSAALLHEMFHVVEPSYYSRGGAEVYSWDKCSSGALLKAQAFMNVDNYVYYAIAKTIPAEDYLVYDGRLMHIETLQAQGATFVITPIPTQ